MSCKSKKFVVWERVKLSSANAFNLDKSNIFSFGKDLTLSSIYTHYNRLKKKALGKHFGKRWNFHVFYAICILNPFTLSQTTNFRPFQTEGVCRRQFRSWWKWKKVLQTDRKHCGKRRNCSLREISPFPTVLSKDLSCRHIKTRAC